MSTAWRSRESNRRPGQQYESLVEEVHMSSHDREEQEWSHIASMICALERLIQNNPLTPTNAVTTPDYWRTRIKAALAAPDLPRSMAQQAAALLTRLDSLSIAFDNRQPSDQPHAPVDGLSDRCRNAAGVQPAKDTAIACSPQTISVSSHCVAAVAVPKIATE
jgi:hypothetical protein